jgi:hypothetical protein
MTTLIKKKSKMAKIDFLALAVKAAEIAGDKKAIDAIILNIYDVTTIAKLFCYNYSVLNTADKCNIAWD